MTVFDNEPMGYSESETRKCKRDYEKLIKDQRIKNTTSLNLRDALYNYIEIYNIFHASKNNQFTLPALIGSLELEIKYGNKQVETLIREQEQDK